MDGERGGTAESRAYELIAARGAGVRRVGELPDENPGFLHRGHRQVGAMLRASMDAGHTGPALSPTARAAPRPMPTPTTTPTPSPTTAPISTAHWTRVTLLGWLLGVPLIALMATAGEMLKIESAQFLVGAGMGLGVGWMQGSALRATLGGAWRWAIATMLVLAIPFAFFDVAKLRAWDIGYSLQWAVTVGGLLVGMVQAQLLATRLRGTTAWIPATFAGYALSVAVTNGVDAFSRSLSVGNGVKLAMFLGGVVLGGVVLGLTTGWAVGRLRAVDA